MNSDLQSLKKRKEKEKSLFMFFQEATNVFTLILNLSYKIYEERKRKTTTILITPYYKKKNETKKTTTIFHPNSDHV